MLCAFVPIEVGYNDRGEIETYSIETGIPMTHQTHIERSSLRILEIWLPLAQQENMVQKWGYDAAGLEALILASVPALRQAQTVLSARYILWHTHRQYQQQRSKGYPL